MEPQWRELSSECRWPSLLISWEWASTWWKHFGALPKAPRRLCVIVVEERGTGRILGIAPFHYRPESIRWHLKPRRLELFGQLGLEETLGDEPVLLLRANYEQAVLRAILRHLYAPGFTVAWDFLSMQVPCEPGRLLIDGPPALEIERRSGRFWEQLSYPGRMESRLGSDWEKYRRSLSKSMRDNTAYYPHRLRKHQKSATVEYVAEPSHLTGAIDLLIDLHSRRAQDTRGIRHGNHLSGSAQRAMLHDILQVLAAEGKAFLAVLRIDGAPAAAQAFLRREDAAIVFYYSGHEPSLAEYSPLTLLTMDVLKTAIVEGCRAIDFLPGKVLWKERWGATPEYDVEEFFCVSGTLRSKFLAWIRRCYMATQEQRQNLAARTSR